MELATLWQNLAQSGKATENRALAQLGHVFQQNGKNSLSSAIQPDLWAVTAYLTRSVVQDYLEWRAGQFNAYRDWNTSYTRQVARFAKRDYTCQCRYCGRDLLGSPSGADTQGRAVGKFSFCLVCYTRADGKALKGMNCPFCSGSEKPNKQCWCKGTGWLPEANWRGIGAKPHG